MPILSSDGASRPATVRKKGQEPRRHRMRGGTKENKNVTKMMWDTEAGDKAKQDHERKGRKSSRRIEEEKYPSSRMSDSSWMSAKERGDD